MTDQNPTNLRPHWNVHTAEREKPREPFVAVIGGPSRTRKNDDGTPYIHDDRAIVFPNPRDQPWQDIMALDSPVKLLRFLPEEDKEFVLDVEMPGEVFGSLMKAYAEHLGLGTPGNDVASLLS